MKISLVERYKGSTAAFFQLSDIPSARIWHHPDKPPFAASRTDMGWCANFGIHVTDAPHSFCPNRAMSSGISSFEATASLPCTISRICSTTSGFANVVTSPTSRRLEIEASTRRMILPLRVFGISAAKRISPGPDNGADLLRYMALQFVYQRRRILNSCLERHESADRLPFDLVLLADDCRLSHLLT